MGQVTHKDESVLALCAHSDLGPIAWLFLLCQTGVIPPPTSQGRVAGSVSSCLSSAAWHSGFSVWLMELVLLQVLSQGDVKGPGDRRGEGAALPGG